MNVVGKVGSFITQGVYSVATPFHPFGGAVDIIVVKQHDGSFRSTPWYVRFGKFQGVLKGSEKVVRIEVNGVEANFHMHLDNSGEAYFVREVESDKDGDRHVTDSDNVEGRREENDTDTSNTHDENDFYRQDSNDFSDNAVEVRGERLTLGMDRIERTGSDSERIFYEFQDEQSSLEGSVEYSEYGSDRYDNLDGVDHALESQDSSSEVVLVSVDGHILTAPLSSSERTEKSVQLNTPQFHLDPGRGTDEYNRDETTWSADYLNDRDASPRKVTNENAETEALSFGHQLEPCEGDEEHLHHAQETDSSYQDRELCIDSSPENKSSSLMRNDVFKSCLELSELAVQSTDDDQENAASLEILEGNEDPLGKSPRSPSIVDGTEEVKCEISRNVDVLSSNDSRCPSSITLPDLQVEVPDHERNTFDADINGSDSMPDQFVSNDQESHKQIEVDPAEDNNQDWEGSPSFEDECSKSERTKHHTASSVGDMKPDFFTRLEISLCGNLLRAGMGLRAAEEAFVLNRISLEEFKLSAPSIVKNENLVVRVRGKYLPWDKAVHLILGMVAFGLDPPIDPHDAIAVERGTPRGKDDDSALVSTPSRRWRLWPTFRRVKTLDHRGSNASNEDVFVDSESVSQDQSIVSTPKARVATESPRKQIIRTNVPTTDQIASLNLKEGQNMVNFIFSTRVLGLQKVEAHIYLWKWNTRIVISDVDGTITKSDVLGQFMPLVGKDWTHSGIARLFTAIKENGYQLMFLSARAIVQAYLTKSFLFNLKQDGKSLPTGPVVISPDGLFPSLYREVIRRAPHEFKIACLEDIKALFPPDYNPFYAGFGNRDTDELSYRKIGIPKGKIFIINPKGEVAINHRIDVKSYTSLHTLVHDMFPPTSLAEQEDYNSWNYWKMPLPDIDL